MGTSDRCEYHVTAAEWERTHETEWRLETDEWSCSHSSGDDSYCVFHRPLSEKQPGSARQRLVELVNESEAHALQSDGKRRKQFVGATFHALELDYLVLDGQDVFPIDLRQVEVADALDLSFATVRHPLLLDGAELTGPVRLREMTIEGVTSLRGVGLRASLTASDATFRDLNLARLRNLGPTSRLDFSGATIERGSFVFGADEQLLYDLSHARLGDISLEGGEAEALPFERLALFETSFDGFDFAAYHRELRQLDWRLHATAPWDEQPASGQLAADGGRERHLADFEGTYLNAKPGAESMGDEAAAARFYERQMQASKADARRAFVRSLTDGSSLSTRSRTAWDYLSLSVLGTIGFTVRPARLYQFVTMLLATFSLLYLVLPGSAPAEQPTGALLLSVQAFTGFDMGVAISELPPLVQMIVHYERFVGVFAVAVMSSVVTEKYGR